MFYEGSFHGGKWEGCSGSEAATPAKLSEAPRGGVDFARSLYFSLASMIITLNKSQCATIPGTAFSMVGARIDVK